MSETDLVAGEIVCDSCGGEFWGLADESLCHGCGRVLCDLCEHVFDHLPGGEHANGNPTQHLREIKRYADHWGKPGVMISERARKAIASEKHDPRELLDALGGVFDHLRQGYCIGLRAAGGRETILALGKALSLELVLRLANELDGKRLDMLEAAGFTLAAATNFETGDRKWLALGPGDDRGPVEGHSSVRGAIDSITWRPS